MTNVHPFSPRQAVGSQGPHGPRRHRRGRRPSWRALGLTLPLLAVGIGALLLSDQPGPISDNFQQLASTDTATKAGAASVRFEICGQGDRINCVVDGDTIWYWGVKIRLATIDAPEIHDYKCPAELALGERSKRRLLELVNAGPFEVVRSGSRDEDKYGRKLRDVRRGGRSFSEILIAEGLASRWEGQHHVWC